MAIQSVNLGNAPTGAGGDTFRSTGVKINENFTNPVHAASRQVGLALGDVMEVGAFGLGGSTPISANPETLKTCMMAGVYIPNDPKHNRIRAYLNLAYSYDWIWQLRSEISGNPEFRFFTQGTNWGEWYKFKTELNTAVDGNGFIKSASPVVQLLSHEIRSNDEAKSQEISFEKVDVGEYLIKGSSGFAQEGWYVETPKDANGNVLFSVIYDTLENGDISVKTYKKKFDLETASIVADLDSPVDITEGRWIDVRLQELPKPEIKIPESATPPDFQPTGLAQAVAAAMESYNDPK